jgi:importin subunit alpha-2
MDELKKVSLHVEEFGGLERIEDSQSHANSDIYRKSLSIWEQ